MKMLSTEEVYKFFGMNFSTLSRESCAGEDVWRNKLLKYDVYGVLL